MPIMMQSSPISLSFDVPEAVRELCQHFAQNDVQAFLVGGSLRDLLRGAPTSDWDIATDAPPARVMKLFSHVIPTGIAHGTVTVLFRGQQFEVTTFRAEAGFSDGRHPDAVRYLGDIRADLSRRDFTINAMAWDPLTKDFYDLFGGRADLQAGVIRAVGHPEERFAEDGLRIMRAARFASVLGFAVAPETARAIETSAHCLANVSVERRRDEFSRLLLGGQPSCGLRLLRSAAIMAHICPLLTHVLRDDAGELHRDVAQRLDEVPPRSLALRLSALLLSLPYDAALSAWLTSFRFDRKTQKHTSHLLQIFGLPRGETTADIASLRALASAVQREYLSDYCDLLRAWSRTQDAPMPRVVEGVCTRLLSADVQGAPLSIAELAVTGTALMQELSLPPGPQIGELLRALLAEVLRDPAANQRDALLSLARQRVLRVRS